MHKLIFIVLLSILFGCNQKEESISYSYKHYKHYFGNENVKAKTDWYYRVVKSKLSDTLLKYEFTIDSFFDYSLHKNFTYQNIDTVYKLDSNLEMTNTIDTILLELNKFNRQVYLYEDSLHKSKVVTGDNQLRGTYRLSIMKRIKLNDKEYLIYRFDHDFEGCDGEESLFYNESFGFLAEYSYSWNSLLVLNEISNFEDTTYKFLVKNILKDTVFTWTSPFELKYKKNTNL